MRPERWIVLVALLAASPGAFAAGPGAQAADDARVERLVGKIEQRYRALGAFKVSFRQFYRSATFGSEEEAKGSLLVAGERMLWLYDVPRGQKGALDGDRYWLIVPEDQQVIVREVSQGGGDPLAQLLLGRSDILGTFKASPVSVASVESRVAVELTPRVRREDIERAVIEIDEAQEAVRRVEFLDPLGNRMVFELGPPAAAPPPPASAFKLTIPPGFTVTTH